MLLFFKCIRLLRWTTNRKSVHILVAQHVNGSGRLLQAQVTAAPPSTPLQINNIFQGLLVSFSLLNMPLKFELCPGRMIGGNHPCFIIAEIGQNHQGDIEIAKKMIKMAKVINLTRVALFSTWISKLFIFLKKICTLAQERLCSELNLKMCQFNILVVAPPSSESLLWMNYTLSYCVFIGHNAWTSSSDMSCLLTCNRFRTIFVKKIFRYVVQY